MGNPAGGPWGRLGRLGDNPDALAFGRSMRTGLKTKKRGFVRRFTGALFKSIGFILKAGITLVAAAVAAFTILFVSVAVTTGVAALAAWIAGWFFPETFTAIAHLLGLQAPYQFGAVLGFVAGFFGGGVIKRAKG